MAEKFYQLDITYMKKNSLKRWFNDIKDLKRILDIEKGLGQIFEYEIISPEGEVVEYWERK